jgi:hypothetical protein
MERPQLEKVIEKLKGLDIQRWKFIHEHVYSGDFLITETNGLRFSIFKRGSKGRMEDTFRYSVFVEDAGDEITNNCFIEYTFDKKSKPQRELLDKFYEKTLAALKGYKEKEIKEKLDNFVSE